MNKNGKDLYDDVMTTGSYSNVIICDPFLQNQSEVAVYERPHFGF